jgi:hypothetical protein
VDGGVGQLRVIAHPLLDEAGQGGEHKGTVDPLLVHQGETGGRLPEGRDRLHGLPEDLPPGFPFGIAETEIVLLRSRASDHVKGRVGNVLADLSADDDFGPAPHVDIVNGAPVPVRQIFGQRLAGLIEVVVGVEQRDVQRASGHGSSSVLSGENDTMR